LASSRWRSDREAIVHTTHEHARLAEQAAGVADWQRWGTYVSERAWGTVREDYSADGNAWDYFPHDHARSRAYRWNEDGLAGVSDRDQYLCLAIALWNGRDAILKERLFGLSNREGNHGEDVKEIYFHLDNTPTHSYARMLYKYPQAAYPYAELVAENARRGVHAPEFELVDALESEFAEGRYFDVVVEYAKRDSEDLLGRIQVINRGPEAAPIHVLPHLWFRNTWSWTADAARPRLEPDAGGGVHASHDRLGDRWWYVEADGDATPDLLFTENDSNAARLFGAGNASPFVKDGINDAVVLGRTDAVTRAGGTKAAAHVRAVVPAGGAVEIRVRLTPRPQAAPFAGHDRTIATRRAEADAFYDAIQAPHLDADARLVQRQALAGLLWSKQFYHFDVHTWLTGDPAQPPPPEGRRHGRNRDWALHVRHADVLLMPDKWEYPWYASWDLAFQAVVMALVDPVFAKAQLRLLLEPRAQHPYGAVPAYEWDFGAVNPPVLAWAAWQIYHLDRRQRDGEGDRAFLTRAFDGLALMLGWWVNRKDSEGRGVFGGGFLGLDNIGLFDRDRPLPTGGTLEQSDGTGWTALFQLNMAAIALELSACDARFEPYVHRFGQHFALVAGVLQRSTAGGHGLWDDEAGFYFDAIRHGSVRQPLAIFSLVGLVPLFAAAVVDDAAVARVPGLGPALQAVIDTRADVRQVLPGWRSIDGRRLFSVVDRDQLQRVLDRVLDAREFLSDYGVRSLSRRHRDQPAGFTAGGEAYAVGYRPGVSDDRVFGGNSNWRGPIWFPMNFLLIQALDTYARYYGDSFTVEFPRGSGRRQTLDAVADDLAARLTRIFRRDAEGRRPVFGRDALAQRDPHFRDHIPFHEFFHGDDGTGLGASHQTGWTALVALLLQFDGRLCFEARSRSTAQEVLS
jgi:hypothetical protein